MTVASLLPPVVALITRSVPVLAVAASIITDATSSRAPHRDKQQEGCSLAELSTRIPAGSTEFAYATHVVPYLRGAHHIEVVDPHVRTSNQAEALTALIDELALTQPGHRFSIHLTTRIEGTESERCVQRERLTEIARHARDWYRCQFTWEDLPDIHDRYLEGEEWRVHLGLGIAPWSSHSFPIRTTAKLSVRKEFFVHYERLV